MHEPISKLKHQYISACGFLFRDPNCISKVVCIVYMHGESTLRYNLYVQIIPDPFLFVY